MTRTNTRVLARAAAFMLIVGTLVWATCVCAAQIRVVSGLTQHFNVSPGGTYDGVISVLNTGNDPQSVSLYQTDYRFDADGGTVYAPPGTQTRSNAAWTKLGPSPVTVPPGQTLKIPFSIVVPTDPHLSGTYWSMIMVEALTQGDNPSATPKTKGKTTKLGITQRLRYGIQVVTDVGDSGAPKLVAKKPHLVKGADGSLRFQVDLANQGTRWVVPKVWMEVYSATGKLQGKFPGQQLRLYPNTSVRERLDFGKLQPGTYQAVLIADGGGATVFGVRYNFNVKAS